MDGNRHGPKLTWAEFDMAGPASPIESALNVG